MQEKKLLFTQNDKHFKINLLIIVMLCGQTHLLRLLSRMRSDNPMSLSWREMRRVLEAYRSDAVKMSIMSHHQSYCISGYLGDGGCRLGKCLIWRTWRSIVVITGGEDYS